ncbi:MAG: adenylate/guanylate cyclase domain-containing protein [Candidatus Rokuibacteriota bacterium]
MIGRGDRRARIQLRQLVAIVLLACTLTPIFNILTDEVTLAAAAQGVIDALLVSVLVGGYLLFVRDGRLRPWFRRLRFTTDLAISSSIVLALFLIGRAVGQVVTGLDPARFLTSFTERHLLYALPFFVVLAVGTQFVLQMNRMIGANVLRYFVAGRYHRPTAEERIFLFLDLEGSTTLAERLGSARYFELLRRFVDDLTDPIVASRGEIYQYAGDEVVVTWPLAEGVRAANCVRCFFWGRDAVAREAARYTRDFGTVPRFRAGLHGGAVTSGELGDLRRQIVFVGDILNTAARLEEYAKRSGLDLVVSDSLLRRLELPPGVEARRRGELTLRGKEAPVAAYSLSAPPNPATDD